MKALPDKQKGILFILLAALFFSLMSVFVRLAGDLPSMEKALFRNLVAAFVSIGMLKKNGLHLPVIRANFKDLLMRALCGTLAQCCNFYAIDQLTLPDANMLNKLSPFFAILMSIFLLKEKASARDWACILIAFGGALLVIKPGLAISSFPGFAGLLGGFAAGVAYTYVRKMGKNGVPGSIIVAFFSVSSTLIVLPFFLWMFTPMSAAQFASLLMAGFCATGGQLSITAAYTCAPAKEISVYDYTQVIFAAIWGILIFGQKPDRLSVLGYIIIIGAALERFLRDRKN